MLRITADVFSGRENPVRDISDETEARAALRELAGDRSLLLDGDATQGDLGLRGFKVEALGDDLAHEFDLGSSIYLPVGSQAKGARAAEYAERLISLTEKGEAPAGYDESVSLEQPLSEFLTEQLAAVTGATSQSDTSGGAASEAGEEVEASVTCTIELSPFNPGFWNNDPTVRARNNCYNYASNWRTNTFAQPGRGCGHMYTALSCPEVTRAALCDGMHRRFDCFPASEAPRYLVALVMAPNFDYHWYRKQKEGFWGHKPGGTAARNTDNSGRVITNPETANRGPYTQFCGYFYGCNSQRHRIR